MDIVYGSKKIERICTDASAAKQTYGRNMSDKIRMRINEIRAAETVEEMIRWHIGRCHALIGDRKGQYAVDLVHPYRLIFEKYEDTVQIAYIAEIADYH